MSELDEFMLKELEFDDAATRRHAVMSLAKLPIIGRELGTPQRACRVGPDDAATRRHAVMSLAKLPANDRVLELLRGLAESDPLEELRYLAKKAHGELKSRLDTERRPLDIIEGDGAFETAVFEKILAEGSQRYKIAAIQDAAVHLPLRANAPRRCPSSSHG